MKDKSPQLPPDGSGRTVPPGASVAIADRLLAEGLISLAAAAKLLPPVRGKRVSTSSLFRWIVRGKHGIKLEGVRLHGAGWWTSRPALARFAAALTAREQQGGNRST